tara:strand:+ start:422 stop:592 length:171 start_codon:yes stop_codon:yes gene_type:complete
MKTGSNRIQVTMKKSGLLFDKSNDYKETPAGQGKRFYANILKKMQKKFNPKRKRRK